MSRIVEILAAAAPKRISSYGSHPWAIIHAPTGCVVQGLPAVFKHPDLGATVISGPSFFRLKREAQTALDALRNHHGVQV